MLKDTETIKLELTMTVCVEAEKDTDVEDVMAAAVETANDLIKDNTDFNFTVDDISNIEMDNDETE